MPTPLNIQGTTVANIPDLFRAYSEVQPFTYRSGATYTQILESMRVWILDDLVPYLNTNFSDIQDNWVESVQEIVDGINEALQAAINAIAESNVIITDPAIVAALNAASSQSRTYFDGRYLSSSAFTLIAGTGIDATGVADSTAAINALFAALPDGANVVVPPGVFNITDTLVLPKRATVRGPGQFRWSAGIGGKAALDVRGDGTILAVRMLNTVAPFQSGGSKQYGIQINANEVTVSDSVIDGFQQAISVMPGGEYYGTTITGNHVLNVPGSGDGASSSSNNGEDRGDGITVWGAAATITGNRVTAANGTDARIGIHTEALPNFEVTHGAHSSSLVTISGNVISGKFRRGIVAEEVSHVTISANAIADSTWWGIAVIGGTGCVVQGNTINWTRTAADNQGSAWSVNRSAIMMYGHGDNNKVSSNTLITVAGANLPFALYAFTSGTGKQNKLTVVDNTFVDAGQTMNSGIYLNGGQEAIENAIIAGNQISGYNNTGIYTWNCNYPEVYRNLLTCPDKRAVGINFDGSTSGARCDHNSIFSASTGIKIYNRWKLTTVFGNMIYNTDKGVDAFGTQAQPGAISSNLYVDCVVTQTP